MIYWRTLVLVSAFCACVESTSGRPDGASADAPLATDGTADAWPVDAGPDVSNDTDRPDGSDSGVDFFSTPGCYLSQDDCVARRKGVRCQALFGGRPRAAEQCRERVFLGCMEHVRSTSPAAVCLRRQEANGVSATYVVTNAYDYEFLAEHERYAWGEGQCEAAFGWPYCAAP